MAQDKKSFVLYADQRSIVNMLSDEDAGKLMKHIYSYVNDESPVSESPMVNLAFEPIKLQLKRDLVRYDEKKKKYAEAGRKGGEARASNAKQIQATLSDVKQPQAFQAVNDNVNVTVTVNDTVIQNTEPKGSLAIASPVKKSIEVFRDKENIELKRQWDSFNNSLPQATTPQEQAQNRTQIKNWIEEHRPDFIEPYGTAWNLFAYKNNLAQIQSFGKSRLAKFNTRIRDPEFKNNFYKIFEGIQKSEFLRGKGGWKVDFDWIFENDNNYRKIIENGFE